MLVHATAHALYSLRALKLERDCDACSLFKASTAAEDGFTILMVVVTATSEVTSRPAPVLGTEQQLLRLISNGRLANATAPALRCISCQQLEHCKCCPPLKLQPIVSKDITAGCSDLLTTSRDHRRKKAIRCNARIIKAATCAVECRYELQGHPTAEAAAYTYCCGNHSCANCSLMRSARCNLKDANRCCCDSISCNAGNMLLVYTHSEAVNGHMLVQTRSEALVHMHVCDAVPVAAVQLSHECKEQMASRATVYEVASTA
eukprot:14438-Heterococcus_DN1.PRE.3